MKHLDLDRPLVIFDLETTGTDPGTDRIVEISLLRIEPGGDGTLKTRRLNPGRPIPAEATAVHGIGDADVADAPEFRQVARSLLELLAGADLAGFNVARFDVPLLDREFRDVGLDLDLGARQVIDAMTIFHRMEPRDLSAAARFYLGRDHTGAHAAEADVVMTAEILDAQLERYGELPRKVDELAEWIRPRRPGAVDRDGKFVWQDGEVVVGFGKHQGKPLAAMVEEARDYLEWVLKSDFPEDAKGLVRDAFAGRFPEAP